MLECLAESTWIFLDGSNVFKTFREKLKSLKVGGALKIKLWSLRIGTANTLWKLTEITVIGEKCGEAALQVNGIDFLAIGQEVKWIADPGKNEDQDHC